MIFFDLDDTLLDHQTADYNAVTDFYKTISIAMSLPEFLAAWRAAQERHYVRYYAGEISFQQQRRERLREVIDSTLNDEAADRIFARYLNGYESHWVLFDDVLPCFERLSTHRLGLITNGDGILQRRKLAKTGITDKFDCIVISDECGYAKPDKEIFLYACELAGEDPKNSVHIGDRINLDAQGACNAGLRGIWLNRKSAVASDCTTLVIASLDALPAVL
jgi:putative hydrolase of the HAD superfamily